jgi:hypothetical protein
MAETIDFMVRMKLTCAEGMTKEAVIKDFDESIRKALNANRDPVEIMELLAATVAAAADSIEVWEE